MRHEDALLVRRLAQNNAPGLAPEVYTTEGDTIVSYREGTERRHSADLSTVLGALARAVHYAQPFLLCTGCGQVKAREHFFNFRRGDSTRKQTRCKTCSRRFQRERYHQNPTAARQRDKRYRLQGRVRWNDEWSRRSKERQRAVRLAMRLARAGLLLELCAQEYGLTVADLRGWHMLRLDQRHSVACVLAARLVRAYTFLHPAAIAELLDCTEEHVAERIRMARKWTHHQNGDVRVRDAMARIRAAYRRQRESLHPEPQPYSAYTPAQRRSGRADRGQEEGQDETTHVS